MQTLPKSSVAEADFSQSAPFPLQPKPTGPSWEEVQEFDGKCKFCVVFSRHLACRISITQSAAMQCAARSKRNGYCNGIFCLKQEFKAQL
jgi:hypothetical protein